MPRWGSRRPARCGATASTRWRRACSTSTGAPSTTEDRRRVLIASPGSSPFRLRIFGASLALLAILKIAAGYVAVPPGAVYAVSVAASVVFLVLPIVALFVGAGHRWDLPQAIAVVVLGVLLHGGSIELVRMAATPAAKGVVQAMGQIGLVTWCMGMGAALACLIKDRNMLLPIAAFLALFDVWLVFAPEGFVSQVVRKSPAPLAAIGYKIPQIAVTSAPPAQAPRGLAADLLYVGPADFLFLAMFFVALYRFGMRPRETFRAVAPVLVAYLGVVLLFPDVSLGPIRLGALPALLPIGLTVLWTNRREFRLMRDEKIITLGLLIVGIPFVVWRIVATQAAPPEPPADPVPKPHPELSTTYRF